MSNEAGEIYGKLVAVQSKVGAIGKDGRNDAQRYNFRGIDAVYNACGPAFRDEGVLVLPDVIESSTTERATRNGGVLFCTRLRVRHTFAAADGSSVSCTTEGEGMDSGDKATNKAMSAAYKYAIFETLCIPVSDLHDADKDSPEPVAEPVKDDGVPKITADMRKHLAGVAKEAACPSEIAKCIIETEAGCKSSAEIPFETFEHICQHIRGWKAWSENVGDNATEGGAE